MELHVTDGLSPTARPKGMETNSHRVGLFMETIKAFEFVTADGEVKKVTAESDPEVFYALPFSHGSFGFLTSVTASILRVKPYMHVEYIPTFSRKELRDKMVELATSDNAPEFLEATVYAKEQAVIQVGNFSEKPADDSKINAINRFWKPFYFRWVETFLKKGRSDEYIPLEVGGVGVGVALWRSTVTSPHCHARFPTPPPPPPPRRTTTTASRAASSGSWRT